MNLNNGNGDAPSSASLNESKEMMPGIIHRKKNGAHRKKGRKVLSAKRKKGAHRKKRK
jgi:hypothetical protein